MMENPLFSSREEVARPVLKIIVVWRKMCFVTEILFSRAKPSLRLVVTEGDEYIFTNLSLPAESLHFLTVLYRKH
jgi:hypothetical protein